MRATPRLRPAARAHLLERLDALAKDQRWAPEAAARINATVQPQGLRVLWVARGAGPRAPLTSPSATSSPKTSSSVPRRAAR